jgi:DNA-binding winged helix-turn-helix (wHTH) protein/TolB-like protein/Flp pilus assembly protein TadD
MDTRTSRALPVGPTAEFHPPSSELRLADRVVRVRPQTAAVLTYLLLRPGRAVGKDELLAAVWPGVVVTENSLAQCIAEIRRELGETNQDAIRTLPRRGYCFQPPLQPVVQVRTPATDRNAEALAISSVAAGQNLVEVRRPRRWLAVAAASLSVAIAGAAGYGSDRTRWWPTQPPEAPQVAIAVLPLASDAGSDQQRALAERITDELTRDLAEMPAAAVIAKVALAQFSGGTVDAGRVGHELGATYVVEGRVLSEDGRQFVDLQLVNAVTGVQQWSERIDLEPGLLQVDDRDVTGRIAQIVQAELMSAEIARRPKRQEKSVGADDLALHAWMLSRRASREDNASARALARQAIALDPDSVLAWRALAASIVTDHVEGWTVDPEGSLDTAESAIRRALTIDPGQPQAHAILGAIMAIRGRHVEALAALERELSAGARHDPQVHEWLGITYLWMGKPRQAIRPLETAVWLNPRSQRLSEIWRTLAMAHWHIGDLCFARDRAWAAVRTPQPAPRAYETLAAICTMYGDGACANDALAELRRVAPLHDLAKVRWDTPSSKPDFVARQSEYVAALRMAGLP